jgi:hypothetical protein
MPEIILAIGAVVVMLVIAFKRNAMVSNVLTSIDFWVSFLCFNGSIKSG